MAFVKLRFMMTDEPTSDFEILEGTEYLGTQVLARDLSCLGSMVPMQAVTH